jgi:hypothetical protein
MSDHNPAVNARIRKENLSDQHSLEPSDLLANKSAIIATEIT